MKITYGSIQRVACVIRLFSGSASHTRSARLPIGRAPQPPLGNWSRGFRIVRIVSPRA